MRRLIDVPSKHDNSPSSITFEHALQLHGLAIAESYYLRTRKAHPHRHCRSLTTIAPHPTSDHGVFVSRGKARHITPTLREVVGKLTLVFLLAAEHFGELLVECDEIGCCLAAFGDVCRKQRWR